MPPDDQDWVMVEATATSGYLVHTCSAGLRDATFGYHGPFAAAGDALDAAHGLASKMGLDTIFTKGLLGG